MKQKNNHRMKWLGVVLLGLGLSASTHMYAQVDTITPKTDLTAFQTPAATNITWHTDASTNATNQVSNAAAVDPGTYYAVKDLTTCKSLPSIVRIAALPCGSTTVDLSTLATASNLAFYNSTANYDANTPMAASDVAAAVEGKYYVADTSGGCKSGKSLIQIVSSKCVKETAPDINVASAGQTVDGNLATNDQVVGATYGTPVANTTNPDNTLLPTVNPDGTYTFATTTSTPIGVYVFTVPVTKNGVTVYETLTITVNPEQPTATTPPVANTDVASTTGTTPVDIDVKANDVAGAPGSTLGTPTISTAPTNGTATVNPDGTIKYTPNTGFVGTDTITYQVCDDQTPANCATATTVVTVYPDGAQTPPAAADDFSQTTGTTPATGNVVTNDTKGSSGTPLEVKPETNKTIPGKGTYTLNADGTYSFTPESGFTGTVAITYNVCDTSFNPDKCKDATLYITVRDQLLSNDIISFDAKESGKNVVLNWELAKAAVGSSYTVQHAVNKGDFKTIGSVVDNGALKYSFNHKQPSYGVNYYRLILEKADQARLYSKVALVKFNSKGVVATMSPNPANNFLNVGLSMNAKMTTVSIYSIQGRALLHETFEGLEKQIDISKLPVGNYVVKIMADDYVMVNQLIIRR